MKKLIRVGIGTLVTALAAAPSAVLASEVNVYTSRQPQLIEPILQVFEDETGIKANVLSLQQGLIERVKLEGAQGPADLIMTVDIGRMSLAVSQGITQPITDAELLALVPAHLRGANNEWIGLTTRARVSYVSKDRVPPGEVTTYEGLADPKWQGRICSRSGRHNYNIALLSAYIAHHGAAAAETWLQGIKANLARRPQGNDRAQIKAIWAGECDIAIGNTYYMGKLIEDPMQRIWMDAVRIDFPRFEDGGTHINISGAAIAKHAPNLENAYRLLEFLTSDLGQTIYALANYEYPVRPDVEIADIVASWGTFTPDTVDLTDIAELRATALEIVDRVGFDK